MDIKEFLTDSSYSDEKQIFDDIKDNFTEDGLLVKDALMLCRTIKELHII